MPSWFVIGATICAVMVACCPIYVVAQFVRGLTDAEEVTKDSANLGSDGLEPPKGMIDHGLITLNEAREILDLPKLEVSDRGHVDTAKFYADNCLYATARADGTYRLSTYGTVERK